MRRREFREFMDSIHEEHRLHRAELKAMREEQRHRFDGIDAAIENDRSVTREILLELREARGMLRDVRHGIQANTEGLLRVLDDLRRGGPAAAGS